jgi:YfiH family protein
MKEPRPQPSVPSFGNPSSSLSVLKADWPAPSNVHALVTLRGPAGFSQPPFDSLNLGVRGGDVAAGAMRNRRELRTLLRLPSSPQWLQQVHGTGVLAFDQTASVYPDDLQADDVANILQAEPFADAAVTATSGVVLAILTADCLPVLFCADDGSEIGAAHAGWRGLSAGVLERTIGSLRTSATRLVAWLGPAIGAASYEVGEEVRAAFVDRDRDSADAFAATRPGHWHCDLYQLAQRRLAQAGIARVRGGGFDTFADPRFYSWRRDGARSGRFASLIWTDVPD